MKSCIQKYSSFVNFIDRAHFLGADSLGCVLRVSLFLSLVQTYSNLVQAMSVGVCESPFSSVDVL